MASCNLSDANILIKRGICFKTFEITFVVRPEVNITKDNDTIICIVRANPSPDIVWNACQYNGTSCHDLEPIIAKENIARGIYKSSVSVNFSTPGFIRCEAKNEAGSASKQLYLSSGRPEKPSRGKGTFLVIGVILDF